MQKTTITFRISKELKNQLKKIAEEKCYNFTELTRKIVENYVKTYNL